MSSDGVPFLLITANVGSIFEDPSAMLKIWIEEFLSTIAKLDPKFIALHCQEVGGKNYEESMRHVEDFVKLLMSSEELRLFDKVRVFLDEDFSSAEHFTALGNLYFAHESLKDVLLWDFKEGNFVPANGTEIHSGNIESVTTKEKAKFPQDFFPECKWSRKGFLRTRWSVSGTVFDLINIHLFHDASNLIAMETFPSVYSKTRRNALEHTLERFHNDHYPNAPYFVFGDFNFRTDTAGVIKKLTADTHESKMLNKGSLSKLQFRNESDDLILTLGKKEFSHHDHQSVFVEDSGQWLLEFDKELGNFEGRLFEFPIKFVPSYPFEENIKGGTSYMQTRVPAWCDRVLLSPTAKSLVKDISSTNAVEYGIIGPFTCMGDHKPVYLRVKLVSEAGMINCCSSANPELFCFRVPESYERLMPASLPISSLLSSSNSAIAHQQNPLLPMPGCRSYAHNSSTSNANNNSSNTSNFLHAVPYKHDPYTPDSMDSPSPNTLFPDQQQQPLPQRSQSSKNLDRAVSPALLKSKLELIARSNREDGPSALADNSDLDDGAARSSQAQPKDSSARKGPSNSDVSWQRSHLLTKAWLQGKDSEAYHSFSDDLHGEDLPNLEPQFEDDGQSRENQQLQSDIVIPRIAIINASNFESNASSVHHLHGDDCGQKKANSLKSDQYLDTGYSNQRTRSLSEADSGSATVVEEQYPQDPRGNQQVDAERATDEVKEESIESALEDGNLKNVGENEIKVNLNCNKSTTRSDSIQSQDTNAVKLKAYNKVTERCKRNIVDGKKNRCTNKCCVIL